MTGAISASSWCFKIDQGNLGRQARIANVVVVLHIGQGGRVLPVTEENSMNYTYLLRCRDGSLYCGWTNRLEERLKAHNEGKGAKYTRSRRPVELIYYEEFPTKEQAMSREYAIKRLTRAAKLRLISDWKRETGHDG